MDKGKSKLEETRVVVEDVKGIMQNNIQKAEEREGKLEELEERSEALLEQSKTFVKTTTKVVRKKRWEHMKMKLLVVAVVLVVIAVLIGVVVAFSSSGSSSGTVKYTSNDKPVEEGPRLPDEEP
ncbi:vesicle-associated membrane protein 5 [Amia ocellicauda]|uniref:vesicle-associated membrane protein 5 n=1 Tax=Amia ocellicauda TaxID=2972642 RepID=UPI003464CA62